MSCNHQITRSWWITCDYFGEETEGHYEYETEYTTVDLDTHRYKCTQCKEIMYYSGAAREYYETGVDNKELFRN
jgi:hypothetical protein